MAHYEYHNNMRAIIDTIHDSHVALIKNICTELGCAERSEEFMKKYMDESVKVKKFQDKNHPKKPKSGYMFYGSEHRERVKKSLPEGSSFADITRTIAKEWNALDAAGKEKYSNLAEEDKVRYAKDLEMYNSEVFKHNTQALT